MIEKKLENTSIYYWINDTKAERALIFVHPAFANHTCFDSQLDFFKDYRVITIDLLGTVNHCEKERSRILLYI